MRQALWGSASLCAERCIRYGNLKRQRGRARRNDRQGMSIVYIGFALMAIFAIVSLTVDVGRIRVAKGQVQTAADAAAMAAALTLPTIQLQNGGNSDFNTVDQAARSLALANPVTIDNVPVTLANADIEYGTWDKAARTFTVIARGAGGPGDARQSATAIRITARRAASTGNALPMTFARIFGHNTQDLVATAVAIVQGSPKSSFGIVGIDSIDLGGNASIDSYLPSLGTYQSQPRRYNGNVASNGDIATGNGTIYGDARPGVGKHFTGHAYGYTGSLDKLLVFPPPVVPAGTPTLPSATNVAGGTYQVATLPTNKTYTGPVTIYVTGLNAGLGLNGNKQVFGLNHDPANLKLYFTSGGSISQKGTTDIYAQIYAPLCSFSMNGNNGFYGSMIVQSIHIQGTPDIHYDESNLSQTDRAFSVVLVK